MKKLQITLADWIYQELENLSKQKGLTKSVLISLALEPYLTNQKKEGNSK